MESNNHPITFKNTTFDVIDNDGDVWLKSPQIAEALGYSDESAITRIYARRSDEFSEKMTCTVKLTDQAQAREVRIFSPRGCYALAMFARTPVAKEFRVWVLDVLESIRKTGRYEAAPYAQNPGDKLTREQADTLRNLLTDAVKRLPAEKQGAAMIQGWSRLKSHFKVGYRDIPQAEFTEAVSIVSRFISQGELLDAPAEEPVFDTERVLIERKKDGTYTSTKLGMGTLVIEMHELRRVQKLVQLIAEFIPPQVLPQLVSAANKRMRGIAH